MSLLRVPTSYTSCRSPIAKPKTITTIHLKTPPRIQDPPTTTKQWKTNIIQENLNIAICDFHSMIRQIKFILKHDILNGIFYTTEGDQTPRSGRSPNSNSSTLPFLQQTPVHLTQQDLQNHTKGNQTVLVWDYNARHNVE